ncbi:MAG: hypothetical protein ACOC55_02895 [Candidatus Natronoplasma sp.]
MLGDLLEKKLKDLKHQKILIVMDDGLAFTGKLIDFDSDTIIIKDVYQAPAKEIKWKEIAGEEEEKKVGYIDWTYINLEEVDIRMQHVLRIWRWEKTEEEESGEYKTGKKLIYTRAETLPNQRGSSMGDIQDTFRY